MADCNLVLIHRGPEYVRDFEAIAHRVVAIDPGIAVSVVNPKVERVMREAD